MKVTRYLNGVEISEEEFRTIRITNPTIESIYNSAIERIVKSKLEKLNISPNKIEKK